VSHRDWKLLATDILDAIGRIQAYTDGMAYEAFEDDDRTIDAVIRNFITIGEAAGRVPAEVAAKYADIPWRLMADMRNFAVHHYWGVESEVLWKTIQDDLPGLIPMLKQMAGVADTL